MALRTQIEIEAPIDRVWGVMSDLPNWGNFNSFLKVDPLPPGPLKPGQPLDVSFQPPGAKSATKMKPQVVAFEPGSKELRWRGKLFNTDWFFVGEHFFQLKEVGPAKTLLLHGEDFKGCLVPLLGGLLKDTEKGFADFNQGLKRAAEGKK
ncbi:hypothetical protein HYH02_008043 [Chlamydomonas schloesseri]|uniref:Coenzyme Q-binding protein COQ10 START domain-containing protein n=1 Tax=Chlamydomonas schloesseri TaxID=2026947 RepID=A0A836B3X6_9CHLO|nr:hypothetical protein HYH02_008043 [Chlamydomonas schloesseri]|eukprot:KAG2446887.1 hypothetical protein HYH02_008043 [Chlamydomonas schloesseri]